MPALRENPDHDPLAHPQRVSDLLLYRMSVVTRSTSLPLVRIFEGEFGITRRHWHILALLVEHGALTSSQLATLCLLDAPRVSRAVSGLKQKGLVQKGLMQKGLVQKGLMQKGLVQRAPRQVPLGEAGGGADTALEPGHARGQLLNATSNGLALYARAMQRVSALNAELARTLSLEERQMLDSILRRLQERAASLAEEVAKTAPRVARHRGGR